LYTQKQAQKTAVDVFSSTGYCKHITSDLLSHHQPFAKFGVGFKISALVSEVSSSPTLGHPRRNPGTSHFPHCSCFGTEELSPSSGFVSATPNFLFEAARGGGTDNWKRQAVQHVQHKAPLPELAIAKM